MIIDHLQMMHLDHLAAKLHKQVSTLVLPSLCLIDHCCGIVCRTTIYYCTFLHQLLKQIELMHQSYHFLHISSLPTLKKHLLEAAAQPCNGVIGPK